MSAKAALESKHFREACDQYKELNKRQPGKYTEPLTQAYTARFKGFIEQGMLESASQILDILRGLLPESRVRQLELTLLKTGGDANATAQIAWETLATAQLSSEEHYATLETLLFLPSEPPSALADSPVAVVIMAIRNALKCLCDGESEAMSAALKDIPRHSPMANWKLLLRGWDAWYQYDDATLEKCLNHLHNPAGVAAEIAAALRWLQSTSPDHNAEPRTIRIAFAITGMEDITDAVLATDNLIASNKVKSAFQKARTTLPDFLRHECGPVSALSDYFIELFKANDPAQDDFNFHLGSQLMSDKFPPSITRRIFRSMISHPILNPNHEIIIDCAKLYSKALQKTSAPPKVIARVEADTANRILSAATSEFGILSAHIIREAETRFVRSRKLDPTYPVSGLGLADCYELAGQASNRNRLLDALALEFPNNPLVLLMAGQCCIERKTFIRGLQHLQKAKEKDPENHRILHAWIHAMALQAAHYYHKESLQKGRDTFAELQKHLLPPRHEPDFNMESRWFLLHQLALEQTYGDPEFLKTTESKALSAWQNLEQAMPAFLSWYQDSVQKSIKRSSHCHNIFSSRKKEWLKNWQPAETELLLKFGNHLVSISSNLEARQWLDSCQQFIIQYVQHVIPERFEGILSILWLAGSKNQDSCLSPKMIADTCQLWAKSDRSHPQLKLLLIRANMNNHFLKHSLTENLQQLDKAVDEAKKRGDSYALQQASNIRKQLEKLDKDNQDPFDDDDDDWDDDDDDWDDDDDDWDDDDESDFENKRELLNKIINNMERLHGKKEPTSPYSQPELF